MKMNPIQFVRALIGAGIESVNIMQRHEEWGPDTIDEVAHEFMSRDLAHTSTGEALFRWSPEAPEPFEREQVRDQFVAHYERLARSAAAVLHDAERGIVGTNAMADLKLEIQKAKDFGVVIPRRRAAR